MEMSGPEAFKSRGRVLEAPKYEAEGWTRVEAFSGFNSSAALGLLGVQVRCFWSKAVSCVVRCESAMPCDAMRPCGHVGY